MDNFGTYMLSFRMARRDQKHNLLILRIHTQIVGLTHLKGWICIVQWHAQSHINWHRKAKGGTDPQFLIAYNISSFISNNIIKSKIFFFALYLFLHRIVLNRTSISCAVEQLGFSWILPRTIPPGHSADKQAGLGELPSAIDASRCSTSFLVCLIFFKIYLKTFLKSNQRKTCVYLLTF